MLKINNLVSGYGTVQILNGSNMEVKNQSIVALLGGNGTGKSTILKAILFPYLIFLKIQKFFITFFSYKITRKYL